ncbi:MAG: hypothetical protein CL471_10755 [Acidobacteria bacterium]|nr:hypothetical protein [Acidobacteriota bacterium]
MSAAGASLSIARSAFGLQGTSALEAYPLLAPQLHALADQRARPMPRRGTLTLTAPDGAYALDLARLDVEEPGGTAQPIAPDGLLTFTVEADEPVYLSAELDLEPSDDLRPGLRATVLCDDTVIAAPNVVATLNGHDHWDEVNDLQGIHHIQNAAVVEWPNSYRVFRV